MAPSLLRRPALALAMGLGIACAAALAAPPAAPATEAGDMPMADMPMADYLALLDRIAPAARDGARAYLQAHQQRCGRPLQTAELRRAMSEGAGDAVLMAMIRASHLGDTTMLGQLGQRISCDRGDAR